MGRQRSCAQAIADVNGLNPANILCGNGSDELLGLLCHVYLSPGDEAVITEHGFLVYRIQIMGAGATPVTVKEKDCTVDVDAILAAVTPKTKMVFIANPGNPTGTYVPGHAKSAACRPALPKHVILVLDAAYAEYVRRNDYEAGIELVSTNANVVMTRTFSKVYGLAALRVGWMFGPARDRRRAEPRARSVQHEFGGDRCGRCRRPRPGFRGAGGRTQSAVGRQADGGT